MENTEFQRKDVVCAGDVIRGRDMEVLDFSTSGELYEDYSSYLDVVKNESDDGISVKAKNGRLVVEVPKTLIHE
jgi:uncharacterized beta-barrel protein YwiB (DUF1934 family)